MVGDIGSGGSNCKHISCTLRPSRTTVLLNLLNLTKIKQRNLCFSLKAPPINGASRAKFLTAVSAKDLSGSFQVKGRSRKQWDNKRFPTQYLTNKAIAPLVSIVKTRKGIFQLWRFWKSTTLKLQIGLNKVLKCYAMHIGLTAVLKSIVLRL